ncbi:MAG: hypothetical protein KAY37_02885 [Phycisphaerae bacterium]|nr:hypothetical protein [Phycisphaerae bacterium]
MRHGDHPRLLGILRDEVIRILESQIEAIRAAEFSGRPPATRSSRGVDYQNSLRFCEGDDRVIVLKQPNAAAHNNALQFCLGHGRRVLHEPERRDWMDWIPPEEVWAALARERAPWVALKLLELAGNPA